jgi:hypothetical protein
MFLDPKIDQPADGDPNVTSTTAKGSADPATVMMSYQIDDNAPEALPFTAGNPMDGTRAGWQFDLVTDAGCGPTNTWHTLTIYAWTATVSSKQSTFKQAF